MVSLSDSESSQYWDQAENIEDTRRKNSGHREESGEVTEQSCGIKQPFPACLGTAVKTEGHKFHRIINENGLVHCGNSV